MYLGKIVGKTSTKDFRFKLDEKAEKFQYIQFTQNNTPVLAQIIEIEKEITVIYEPIILNNSITNLSIEYTFTPEIKTKMPDLSIYSKFHDLISINCINKPQTNCKSLLEENFKGILIKFQGNNLLISYNKINLAIDTTKHLQPKFNQFT